MIKRFQTGVVMLVQVEGSLRNDSALPGSATSPASAREAAFRPVGPWSQFRTLVFRPVVARLRFELRPRTK